MKVAVVGAGAWGTTLASLLARKAETWFWAREAEVVESINDRRTNSLFLDGFDLPRELRASGELGAVLDRAEVVVVAVPAQHVRATIAPVQSSVASSATVLSATKGIEQTTGLRMSEVLAEVLVDHDPSSIGIISGPNLAREVMEGQPAATCVAFPDIARASAAQSLVMSDTLRVYTSDDVVGCEIGGAAKNVIAIAAGVADGLGYGMNAKAAVVTRGLAEVTRLGLALGGRPLTFMGLAVNGDLVATCSSPLSRNRRVGEALGRGVTLAEITDRTVAEGVASAPALLVMAARAGVEMPIAATVDALLRGVLCPQEVVVELMQRSPKAELHGIAEWEGSGCTR